MHTSIISTSLIALSFLFTSLAFGKSPVMPQENYALHAVFVINFIKYVQWPEKPGVIKIGVFGETEAGDSMVKLLRGKNTTSQSIEVVSSNDIKLLSDCQVVFVPTQASAKVGLIIEQTKELPLLLITEAPDLIKIGASISFKIVSDKLHFQINEKVITGKKMKVASALTTLAEH